MEEVCLMKKIYWEVPHYKQEGSMTCGLACVRMLLGYYGFNVSEEDILRETYMHKFGSWFSDLAKSFEKRGLKTKVYTINLHIYSPFWEGESKDQLRDRLLKRKTKLKGLLRIEVERAIDYLDMGGDIEVKIPDPKMILKLLEKQPIMIPVSRSLIYEDRIDDIGHYLVINGFDGDNYSVLDPGPNLVKGKEFKVKQEVLEYAWLANNRDSDGFLMEIIK
jgi:ABC-type bacteriocin/lantibiotic exporter with double-glycine peptidase domain